MREFKKQLLIVTMLSFIILLSLSLTGCAPKSGYSDKGEKSPETVSQDADTSISSGYYLSLGSLNESVVRDGAERDESEVTVADKKIVFPQGEMKSVGIKSWSRKEKAYYPSKSELVQYMDALEHAEIVDDVPENVLKKMPKIETHILYLNSHGEFRTIGITDFGNGYHEISVEKDDVEDFKKEISIQSDTGKKYHQVFLRSMEAEKIIKEWIHWESQGEKGFESIQSAGLTIDENVDGFKLTEDQLNKLKAYLKAEKKPAEAPCGCENYFECILDDESQFHFSISADGESISTDRGVYVVDYPDNAEIVELFKEINRIVN
ncbi:MAG: hypothetical protein Q4E73_02415 [Lachnospiraceae bacterium]|nr:hypothetical protein [Lachnospiraceae bacterium]